MKITLQGVSRLFHVQRSYSNKITRVAISALMITNNCLIASMFFIASNVVTGLVLFVSIVGTAIVIEKIYR